MKTLIKVENGDTISAIRGFLKSFLEAGIVDALFVPLETDRGGIVPSLVTNPGFLERANPLAPVMPINSARAVSVLTGKHPASRLGVVLRPCEIRALIELVKLQQASMDGVTVIGLDCPGTYEVTEYVTRKRAGNFDSAGYLSSVQQGQEPALEGLEFRQACKMCINPVSPNVSVSLHLFGADLSSGIPVELEDELAIKLGVTASAFESKQHDAIVDKVVAAHRQIREKDLLAIRAQMNSNGGIASLFDDCIRCHNCMTACPICYCKTCLFKTTTFDHEPDHYFNAARRKGAVRMLGDTLLFHMTRMNHMSASCVSCGMCTSACPSDIPVGAIFSAVGEQVQAAFEYIPGRDLAETLPLITFQPNEWTEVGEAK